MVEDRLAKGFLKMEEVKQKCEVEWKKLAERLDSIKQLDARREEDEFKPSIKVKRSVRIGIRLQTRGTISVKRTMEGFIYGAEYIDYMGVGGRETSVEIVAEIRGNLVKNLLTAQAAPVKFGGEGRVALLSFERGEKILDEIRRRLWNGRESHEGCLALYLAAPALFKEGGVEQQLMWWASSMTYKFVGLSGEAALLGAGFMMKERRRKPIYISLSPGSIIFLEGRFDLLEMYRKAIGEASMLGYGTLIPVPMD